MDAKKPAMSRGISNASSDRTMLAAEGGAAGHEKGKRCRWLYENGGNDWFAGGRGDQSAEGKS